MVTAQPKNFRNSSCKIATSGAMIYSLAREAMLDGPKGPPVRHRFLDAAEPVMGLGISFPWSDRTEAVDYVVNSVWGDLDDESET